MIMAPVLSGAKAIHYKSGSNIMPAIEYTGCCAVDTILEPCLLYSESAGFNTEVPLVSLHQLIII
jgi:hypothetical protein